MNLDALIKIIRDAAQAELMPRFANVAHRQKADGSIVTEADTVMQDRLVKALLALMPNSLILGEEMTTENQQQLLIDHSEQGEQGLWVVDPLDGTRNFAAGIPVFCVSVAWLIHGEVVAGVIYNPVRDECFSAMRDQGAWLNGQPMRASDAQLKLNQCIAVIDFKRLAPTLASCLAVKPPYASQRSFGSGALDWCWLAAHRYQLYLHGNQKLWDYAAGQLILKEAGGMSCTLTGEHVVQATQLSRSVVAVSQSSVFELWKRWVLENQ
jgi:myo-inositol-1(or 4)-monophosphatase